MSKIVGFDLKLLKIWAERKDILFVSKRKRSKLGSKKENRSSTEPKTRYSNTIIHEIMLSFTST